MDTMLFQHGTLANLVPGLFDGTLTIDELLEHGNTGIGTLTGLDGELIILDGIVYQVAASGKVRIVESNESVPFANVHQADFSASGKLTEIGDATIRDAIIAKLTTKNAFAAILMHGQFKQIQTRAVGEQKKPYPTLRETAAAQAVFDAENVTGTVIGYYSPQLYAGVAAPGLHLHFLSDDHQFGGHLLKMDVAEADLAIQTFADFQLHLPIEDEAFRLEDLEGNQIVDDIRVAEK